MKDGQIRPARPEDEAAILAFYPRAFPEEDLVSLTVDLMRMTDVLSLGYFDGAVPLGHVVFTRCAIDGLDGGVGLLGPVAVEPSCQKQGIGSALIRRGLAMLEDEGARAVFVLGDPAYYGRFGFEPGSHIGTPCPIPDEWRQAWQSLWFAPGASGFDGALTVPPVWQRPELWSD